MAVPSRLSIAALIALAALLWASPAGADPANYTRALANVIVAEGGYANHPNDPGGRTLQGIIQRVYDADRATRGLPRRLITPALIKDPEWAKERDAIYQRLYWEPCAGPELPRGLDYIVMDMCVNAGITRGWSMLMRALHLKAERPYAPMAEVRNAIAMSGVRAVIVGYGDARRAFYRGLAASRPSMRVFLTGWLNREQHARRIALAMERGTVMGNADVMRPQTYLMGKAVEDAGALLEVVP